MIAKHPVGKKSATRYQQEVETMTKLTATPQTFAQWLEKLDEICFIETGQSYQDHPDQLFKDWYEAGLTPEDAYYQMMENEYPGVETPNIYYQEFDTFTDADPGL
jgi:hypothetical protein